MRILKNKTYSKWAVKEGVGDDALRAAVDEIERGLIDADLGGHVVKKLMAVGGRGKSGGVRTLLTYRLGDKAFLSTVLPSMLAPILVSTNLMP
ncbi:hypothetical protein GCM10025791_24050 [Halioxenophilus aromaticivorans]|uniref:Uncharacterized protein n=1 Tax=Halioxenophilus aromaticivorans TaxID=1306992 RepID=A0AAV3U360_9ALTE